MENFRKRDLKIRENHEKVGSRCIFFQGTLIYYKSFLNCLQTC